MGKGGGENTFLGGLDWTVLVGKEIMGKSSERVGGGEEVAGVLEAGVPFPPEQQQTVRQKKQDHVNPTSASPVLKVLT